MAMYHHDPDVIRWDLHHLIDDCSITNAGSPGSKTMYEPQVGHVEYVQEGYVEPERANVENDEVIAHAFQEELSRLSLREASSVSTSGNGQLQASVLSQNWLGPSERYYNDDGNVERSVDDVSRKGEETDGNVRMPTPCSSPGGKSGLEEDDVLHTLDIEDESALDGEVGKRLHHMVPVPHVPRINGEIPSVDEEVSDHQRLLDRLLLYDLVENKIQGDGNCQFRALSDQLYRSPDYHRFVRQQIVEQLMTHPELYDGYVPMSYGDYIKRMNKNGEWGDHVTLQAAADSYGVKIFVLTSFKDTCYIEILPHIEKSKRGKKKKELFYTGFCSGDYLFQNLSSQNSYKKEGGGTVDSEKIVTTGCQLKNILRNFSGITKVAARKCIWIIWKYYKPYFYSNFSFVKLKEK